jgi:hypothetical protein
MMSMMDVLRGIRSVSRPTGELDTGLYTLQCLEMALAVLSVKGHPRESARIYAASARLQSTYWHLLYAVLHSVYKDAGFVEDALIARANEEIAKAEAV